MSESLKKKLNKLDSIRSADVINCLRLHCSQEDGKFSVYAPDWSDDRVAEETLKGYPGVGHKAVQSRRHMLFGPFKTEGRARPEPAPAAPTCTCTKDHAVMTERVAHIEAWIKKFDPAFEPYDDTF